MIVHARLSRRPRGVTLIEISVASFVLSILLLVAAKVFAPAMRAWADGQKRSEVSQSLLVTANWIGDDVVRSSPGSLVYTAEQVLGMKCSLGQSKDENNPFNQVVAYWREKDELFRGDDIVTGVDDPALPPNLTKADLPKMATHRRVSSQVKDFGVEVVQPWRIVLHLQLERDGRSAVLETSYSSIYAPFDPNIAEEQPTVK